MQLPEKFQELFHQAKLARIKAYCPYSKFSVGCAILDDQNQIHRGCNVENVSYPSSLCAEHCAIAQMVSSYALQCKILVVTTQSTKPVFPCGSCLQVISEFSNKNALIVAVNNDGTQYEQALMGDLYPRAFTELS